MIQFYAPEFWTLLVSAAAVSTVLGVILNVVAGFTPEGPAGRAVARLMAISLFAAASFATVYGVALFLVRQVPPPGL